jgi:hypothetical protein
MVGAGKSWGKCSDCGADEPTLDQLHTELKREKKRLFQMGDKEKGKFTAKMAKTLRLAIKLEQSTVEGELRIWASLITLLPKSDRKMHAIKAVAILEKQNDSILFANALETLAALNSHVFKDPTIESIPLLKMAITIRSTNDEYENLLDMVWAQRLLAELEEE